jgi:hypothetical protein
MRFPAGKDSRKMDEPGAIDLLRYGIDRGINYVDTAYIYHEGRSGGEGVLRLRSPERNAHYRDGTTFWWPSGKSTHRGANIFQWDTPRGTKEWLITDHAT